MLDVSRQELKFALTLPQAAKIQSRIRWFAQPDPHNGPEGYFVHSLYFDTPTNRDYADKINGEYRRQKLRLRWYGEKPTVYKLERKEKLGVCQRKRSLSIPEESARELFRGDFRCLARMEEPFAQELYAFGLTGGYTPKCLVSYRRTAFFLPENDTRITFDADIRAGYPGCPVHSGSWVTLEVKYRDFLLTSLKEALGQEIIPQESLGKYSLCRNLY